MKILEELKAAYEIGERCHWYVCDNRVFDNTERQAVSAVLRRIPQLIEVVEMIEAYANLSNADIVLDNKYTQRQHFAVDILTKLEGDKGE